MNVTIEIKAGLNREPEKADIEDSIQAIRNAIDGRGINATSLLDAMTILEGIKKQLPETNF